MNSDVWEFIDRRYEFYDKPATQGISYYNVKTNLAGSYILKHELELDRWFLVL